MSSQWTSSSSSNSQRAPPGTKRPFSQQATALPDNPPSSKAPRVDFSQRSPKRDSNPAPPMSSQQQKQPTGGPSSLRGQGSRSRPGYGFGHKSQPGPSGGSSFSKSQKKRPQRRLPRLEGPLHNEEYISQEYKKSPFPLKPLHETTPKSSLGNFSVLAAGKTPTYSFTEGYMHLDSGPVNIWRATVNIPIEPPVIGVGDHTEKKQAERLAALSGVYQLHEMGVLDSPKKLLPQTKDQTEIALSDGTMVNYERARSFMDFYCRRFNFGRPDIEFVEAKSKGGATIWEAVLSVGDRRIGLGSASNKKAAQVVCYLDVTQYLESCDPGLWKEFVEAAKTGADLGLAPRIVCHVSDYLAEDIRDLNYDLRKTQLYRSRPANVVQSTEVGSSKPTPYRPSFKPNAAALAEKSKRLLERHQQYHAEPNLKHMRETRQSLPVFTRAQEVLSHIENNDVTICMAATGSGKTTQIPQMILDESIKRGEGATCNIFCTQPRRLAAISVADRVAKERGEKLGGSVGYQVRFEAKHPEPHGSITFCTIGIFLKKMQSALEGRDSSLDVITHVVVDEVHERDVDTDLLLVVLKRLMADRKARNKLLKIVLMSATIDPTLFQGYFPDDKGQPAKVVEVPGRSFPVQKYFMDDFIPTLVKSRYNWVFNEDSVAKYVINELGQPVATSLGVQLPISSRSSSSQTRGEDLDLPYPLIAATISSVLENSNDGHVLVFCPGWDEIKAVERQLLEPTGRLAFNFADSSRFSIHLLHSTIPLAEQQVIFEPPPPGVRRIILATNIAETSVTIPDVVYVVDTARVKELRFDPERHMSSLVSAWVGSSNLNQRAGRAGRHRPGEYYGILGQARSNALQPYQTVEMKRADLSNVAMHVKALDFPRMSVEEVLAAAIEPPDPERVASAMKTLHMVGAINMNQSLTSLGRVLLQLPVEVQVGRLVLYGSFFRCLDQALTLAAILTNRDPFVSPMHLKVEAAAKKNSWSPDEFRSDVLSALRAYNAWWALQSTGQYVTANRFCSDNFLAKPTLLLISKIKTHLLQSLYHAGVIDVSAGGNLDGSQTSLEVPPELNVNGESLPLLAALIAIASQPKYAIRTGRMFRTSKEKNTMIHPSSVNHRKRDPNEDSQHVEKQLYAYTEMRRNLAGGGSSQTYLVNTTKLDPMTYMLFGAYNLQVVDGGLECDNWLPIVGDRGSGVLDDIQRLKTTTEACMLRVFEGITMSRRHRSRRTLPILPREEESESEDEGDKNRDYSLSRQEVRELDELTRSVVNILNRYSDERIASQSRHNSRPGTPMASPMGSPMLHSMRLPSSGYSTPSTYGSAFHSRPGTPSRLRR